MKKDLFSALVFLAGSHACSAQLILDQSNTGASSTRSLVDNLQTCIQTFTAGSSGVLGAVHVDIETEDCPYPLVCSILDGGASGNVLATQVVEIPLETARSMQVISFSTPTSLTSGNIYGLLLSANCVSGPGHSIWWYKSVNGGYAGGQAYNQWGASVQPEDELNDFYFQTYMLGNVGVTEFGEGMISVFPNPAEDLLTVVSPAGTETEVFDAEGRRVHALRQDEHGKSVIDAAGWPAGIYVVKSRSPRGVYVNRIVKQ